MRTLPGPSPGSVRGRSRSFDDSNPRYGQFQEQQRTGNDSKYPWGYRFLRDRDPSCDPARRRCRALAVSDAASSGSHGGPGAARLVRPHVCRRRTHVRAAGLVGSRRGRFGARGGEPVHVPAGTGRRSYPSLGLPTVRCRRRYLPACCRGDAAREPVADLFGGLRSSRASASCSGCATRRPAPRALRPDRYSACPTTC